MNIIFYDFFLTAVEAPKPIFLRIMSSTVKLFEQKLRFKKSVVKKSNCYIN